MAISPEEFERLPPFLQNFLREQGAAPDLGLTSTPVSTPSAAPLLPPLPRNAEVANDGGGLFAGSPNSPSFLSPEAESAMWARGRDNITNSFSQGMSNIGDDIAAIPGQIANAPSALMNAVTDFFDFAKPDDVKESTPDPFGGYQPPGRNDLFGRITNGPTSLSNIGNTWRGVDRISALRGESSNLGRKIGAAAVPIGAALMGLAGASTAPLAILGGLFNTLGGYHDYDPNADTNMTIDPETGLVSWDSTNMGGGGMYQGMPNAENFVESLAAKDPNMMMHTGINMEGEKTYTNIQDLSDLMAYNREDEKPGSEIGYGYMAGGDYSSTDTPWSYAASNYANLSNAEAMNSLSSRTGNAYNAIASDVYDRGGSYNDIGPAVEQALADKAAAAEIAAAGAAGAHDFSGYAGDDAWSADNMGDGPW